MDKNKGFSLRGAKPSGHCSDELFKDSLIYIFAGNSIKTRKLSKKRLSVEIWILNENDRNKIGQNPAAAVIPKRRNYGNTALGLCCLAFVFFPAPILVESIKA